MPLPPRPDPHAPLPTACLNCGAVLAQPRPRFCGQCGQETNVLPPHFREFVQQFGGAYFSTEGALWRTLKLLLFHPGELTMQYLLGRRKHYLLPLRLYLSVSVFMLLMLRVSGAINFAGVEGADAARSLPERPRSVQLELGFGRAGLDDGVFFCDGPPAWVCKRLQAKLDVDTRTLVQQARLVNDRVMGNAGAILVLLVPLLALGLQLLYLRRGLRYTEHLVFALHLNAFWSLVFALMQIDIEWVLWAGLVAIPAYAMLAQQHVYGGRLWLLLPRTLLLTAAYLVVLTLTAVAVTLVAMLI